MQADLPCDTSGGSLTVVDDGSAYHVLVDGDEVATVDDFLASTISDPPHILIPSSTRGGQPADASGAAASASTVAASSTPASAAPASASAASAHAGEFAMLASASASSAHASEFAMPEFGVTVLGSADGFTRDGTTAGFVLWMRGRGILVDLVRV